MVLIVMAFGILCSVQLPQLKFDGIELGTVVATRGRWEGEGQRCVRTYALSGEE